MALRNFTDITSEDDWIQFFTTELKLSADDATQYAEEFTALKLTGSNIGTGLARPDFANHVNIPFGHILDLDARFNKAIKSENTSASTCTATFKTPTVDKIPRPPISMNTSLILSFDKF